MLRPDLLGHAETRPYALDRRTAVLYSSGYTKRPGHQEKSPPSGSSANGYKTRGDFWYYLLPTATSTSYTPPYGNPTLNRGFAGAHREAVYNDPSLL